MKKIRLKLKALLYIDFSIANRTANSTVSGWTWFNFELILIQSFMRVLVSCKNEEDPFKNESAILFTVHVKLFGFFQNSRAANSIVHSFICLDFELVHVTGKIEGYQIKIGAARVFSQFPPTHGSLMMPLKPQI